jgi:phosphoadenosine phosphosulfate reductase
VSLLLEERPAGATIAVPLGRPRRRAVRPFPTPLTDAGLRQLADRLEGAPAEDIVRWATAMFGRRLAIAASMTDAVLIDVASRVTPGIEVIFLDTQYHFAETLWYVDQVRERYDLNLRVIEPTIEPDDRWMDDPDSCCGARKVVPMARALAGRRAWMTGLRRDEAPTRAKAPIVSWDVGRGLVKVNPIAPWSERDAEQYARDRKLPEHPLRERGYPSIGCWPCTRPVEDGDDPRAGRWAGRDKLECGLHA